MYTASICVELLPTHLRMAMLRTFCCDEDSRDARDADAAEDEDNEPHEAEIVLRPRQVFAHLVFRTAIPPHVDELVRKRLAELERHLFGFRFGHSQQLLIRRTAPELEQPGCFEIGAVDDHPRARA